MGIISSIKKAAKKVGSLGASVLSAIVPKGTNSGIAPIKKPTVTQYSSGTQVGGNFYASDGKTSSAFPGSKAVGVPSKPNSQTGNALSAGQNGGEINAGQSSNGKFQGAAINTATGAFVPIKYKSNAGNGGSTYRATDVVDTSNSSANFRSSPTVGVTDVNKTTGTQNGITSVVNTPTTFLGDKSQYEADAAFQPIEEDKTESEFQKTFDDLMKKFEENQGQSKEDVNAQLEKDYQLAEKEKAARLVSDKIKAINAKADASQLSLIGQGRGIPEAIIGGQQAQIAREAAIAVLPLSAEYAARKGDLDAARDSIDRLYKIKVADIDAKTEHQNKVIEMTMNFADKKTQRKLEAIKLKNQYQREDLKELIKRQDDFQELAFENNQYTLAGKIRLLDHNSKTYLSDLNNLASQLRNKAPTSSGSAKLRYSVEPGDEPQIIANKLGMNIYTLMALNEGVNWYNLQPGQKLNTGQSEFAVPKAAPVFGELTPANEAKALSYILNSGGGQAEIDLFKSNRAYQALILSEAN